MPGLATGADTFEDLVEKLKVVIPESLWRRIVAGGADSVPLESKPT